MVSKTLRHVLHLSITGFVLLWGCSARNEASSADSGSIDSASIAADSPANAEVKIYTVRGTPKKIDTASRTVVIDHEEIEGFMEAMTMPFTVADPALLRRMTIGKPISFTLRVAGWEMVITEVRDDIGSDTTAGAPGTREAASGATSTGATGIDTAGTGATSSRADDSGGTPKK